MKRLIIAAAFLPLAACQQLSGALALVETISPSTPEQPDLSGCLKLGAVAPDLDGDGVRWQVYRCDGGVHVLVPLTGAADDQI